MIPLAPALLFVGLSIVDSLPEGYRYPMESDRIDDWKAFEAELPTPFHARADFNGDGISDDAWILLHESGRGWGLFVFLNQKDGQPVVIKLEEDSGESTAQRYGLEVVEPGEYETACGKGYWDCEAGEPERLDLVLPAIDFFVFESADSVFWWNPSSKMFIRTWMSD